jgi:hypothetical protein
MRMRVAVDPFRYWRAAQLFLPATASGDEKFESCPVHHNS